VSTGRGGGDGDPAVSVVIPTRDRWPLLATTLASALGQDGVPLEVVVVDDGSATAAPVASPFDDPRVRIVRNDRSLGVAGARNRGIEAARGEWIAFLDDDDVWAPAKLRRQLDAAAAARASFAYAGVILVTADRGLVTIADPPAPDRLPQLLAAYNAIPAGASNVVVATGLAREVGGFDPSFGHLADWDLWVRLAAAAPAAACDEPLVGYRLHPQSMRSTAGGAFAELARFDRMHGRPGPPPQGRIWFYRWLADGQVLAGRTLAPAVTSLRGALRCRSRADAIRAARILLRRGAAGSSAPPPVPAAAGAEWLRSLLPAANAVTAPAPSHGGAKRRLRQSAATALDRALRRSGLRAGIALVYHGIRDERAGDPGSAAVVPAVTAATFREQVRHLAANYRLVPAGELRGAALARRRGEPFPLAITFDDDLRSHLELALPILAAAAAPATFFLTGASLHGPASFWWERLERALGSDVGPAVLGTDDPDRAVAAVAALPANERDELSTALLERLGGEEDESGLRSEHVAALAASGCEIGFHTRDHERLTTLDDATLGRAMRDGADELERAAGAPLRCIAYPFGAGDERVAAAARDAGFGSGFTTRGVAVRADADPYLMGRLYPSEASIAHLASQLSLAVWRVARGR
jgi:peptidoglycan/xylan/chitin deacetylase (PgdA/CDA1 family)